MSKYFLYWRIDKSRNRNSSVGIATDYGLDDRMIGFDSQRRLGMFLFDTMFRPALGPTQPTI
jgi:hypothetical protein